jgi:hypothetical protein
VGNIRFIIVKQNPSMHGHCSSRRRLPSFWWEEWIFSSIILIKKPVDGFQLNVLGQLNFSFQGVRLSINKI